MKVNMLMHSGMAGAHLFEVTVFSNDPVEPEAKVTARANYLEK